MYGCLDISNIFKTIGKIYGNKKVKILENGRVKEIITKEKILEHHGIKELTKLLEIIFSEGNEEYKQNFNYNDDIKPFIMQYQVYKKRLYKLHMAKKLIKSYTNRFICEHMPYFISSISYGKCLCIFM